MGTQPTENGAKESNKPDEIIDARCIVEFRPKKDWDGEYGFDWFRIGDYKEKPASGNIGINTRFDEDVVGKYWVTIDPENKWQRFANNVMQKFDIALLPKYKNKWGRYLEKYHKYPDPDSPEFNGEFKTDERFQNLLKKHNYSTKAIAGIDRDYIIPTISLFENEPTKITMLVKQDSTNIEQIVKIGVASEGDFIHFGKVRNKQLKKRDGRIRSNYIEFEGPFTSNPEQEIDLPIELVKTLTRDSTIKAFAWYKDEKHEMRYSLAGMLNVIKNDPEQINVCFVNCKYALDGNPSKPPLTPKDIKTQIDNLTKYLSQAQVIPNITVESLTISQNLEYTNYIHSNRYGKVYTIYAINPFTRKKEEHTIIDKLEEQFNREHEDKCNDYKIFFVDGDLFRDNESGDGLGGRAKDIPSKSAIVSKSPSDETACHELLHCLGLFHSFSNGNYYTYKQLSTSNLMDYPINSKNGRKNYLRRNSLWRWQWNSIKKHIKDEKQSLVIQKIRNKTAK